MEFWGVEVKAGKPLKVVPEEGKLIHVSQAALGEGKRDKGTDSVHLRVKIDDKKFVVGTLSAENFPQLTFDLVFEREFELSHGWANGSVYFCGYTADDPYYEGEEGDSEEFSDEEEEEELPIDAPENGNVEAKPKKVKADTGKDAAAKAEPSAKPKVGLVEPGKDDESDDDDDDEDDSDDELDSDESDDEDMADAGSSDEEEDSDDEDEETPKKVASAGKKRPVESATKTPTPAKKGKLATPSKTDGKGGHTATPHPSKQGGKTPASGNKKEQTPKSAGQVTCKSCTKTFNSETALQSHSKAKHSAK